MRNLPPRLTYRVDGLGAITVLCRDARTNEELNRLVLTPADIDMAMPARATEREKET